MDQDNKNIKNHLAIVSIRISFQPLPWIYIQLSEQFIIAIHATLQYVRELEHPCYVVCAER